MDKKIINKKIFKCLTCGEENLLFIKDMIKCTKCGTVYRFEDNKLFFVDDISLPDDFIYRFKSKFKRFSTFYSLLIKVISPVYIDRRLQNFIKIEVDKRDGIALNLGSGNEVLSERVINVDLFPYRNVDIVADIQDLPIVNETIDTVVCFAVLEHIENPYRAVNEIYRVLKKGGLTYCYMPFIQGFHASPWDYTRFTYEGMKILFKDFEILKLGVGGGPTSGLLCILQEWLAILLSFGSKKLHFVLYLFFMLISFPIKYLDFILSKYPVAKNIASGFYIIARKK